MPQGLAPGSIWPTENFDEVQIREVYSRFGLAMYMAQTLEHGMVNALCVLQHLPTVKAHTDSETRATDVDHFFEGAFAKTFGNMLKAVEKSGVFPEKFISHLSTAKTSRDHLAHRFFREHAADFMSQSGRTRMISECEQLIQLFQDVDHELEELIAPYQDRFGLTKEAIDEEFARLRAEIQQAATDAS